MTADDNNDQEWSENKKMETLDCLRGRLLAERQASRLANEEAQILGDKLVELENKLREETKLRQKAEKKLKFFTKKLQSLNISSEICSTCSANTDPEESPSKSHLFQECGNSKSDSESCSNSEAPTEKEEMVDNSMALVPVSGGRKSSSEMIVVKKKSVSEVLDALRHAREKIESSLMEKRGHMNMIRVGPS